MTITIPESPDQLEELLNDGRKVAELMKEGQFGTAMKAYQGTFGATADGAAAEAQLNEKIQLGVAEFLKANDQDPGGVKAGLFAGRPRIQGLDGLNGEIAWQARKNALYNQAAAGAAVNGTFERPADFFRALSLNCGAINQLPRGGADLTSKLIGQLAEVSKIQNAFGTNAPADGGFLLPEEFRSDLLMVALENAIVRPRATVIPMETQRTAIPAVDSTSNVSTVFGGIQTYWVDEGSQPTETSAKFQQVVLDVKKLMAYCTAPNELVADATAFGAFLDQALPKAIAFEEDYRFMQGTGAGEPLGFINCPAAVIASAVTGQGANTILVDNLAAMFARMLPSSIMNAVWIASIDTFPQLALMSMQGSLNNSTPVWMNNGVQGAPPAMIYGRPVYFTEKTPLLGTTGDISFVDPSFYLIGDRQAIQASASPHFAFNVDKTAYKIIERVDGRPWLSSSITPKNNGPALSPFVQLSSTRT